jgi:ATP-dependent Clp protease protease subunit
MEISLKLILSMRQELYQILADHTGKTFDEIERDSDRDYWLRAEEAKEYGLIDEILVKKIK